MNSAHRYSMRSRRGLSPIISTLLMVVVVVAAASVAVLWSSGALQQLSEYIGGQSAAVQEAIAIEDGSLTRNNNNTLTLRLYVRDVGPVAVVLTEVFISWSPNTIKPLSITPLKTLGAGQLSLQNFNFANSPQLPVATTVTLKVVTSRGASDTFQLFVP